GRSPRAAAATAADRAAPSCRFGARRIGCSRRFPLMVGRVRPRTLETIPPTLRDCNSSPSTPPAFQVVDIILGRAVVWIDAKRRLIIRHRPVVLVGQVKRAAAQAI